MASRAKQIIDSAVDLGKSAVGAAEKRLRGDEKATDRKPKTPGQAVAKAKPAAKTKPAARKKPAAKRKPSGAPAAKPGKPRGPKSGTAKRRAAG
jgi:hypothetical protein